MKRKEPVKKYRNSPESRRTGKQQVENLREVAEKKKRPKEKVKRGKTDTRLKRKRLVPFSV